MSANTQMTSYDLLEKIRQDRAGLALLWSGLTEEQMMQRPGPQADWSVKDILKVKIPNWSGLGHR